MEHNIADMLKHSFSDVDTDFGNLQFDESINASQTQPTTDAEFELKDTSQLWATSDLNEGTFETFTKISEPEKTDDPGPDSGSSSDSSEEIELSNPTGFTIGPGLEMKYDKDQAAGKATSETPRARLEHQARIEHTIEEECCTSSDEDTNDCMPSAFSVGDTSILVEENKENDLSQEGTIKAFQESVGNQGIQSEAHQELSSALAYDENQTPDERSSGSEDEEEEEEEEAKEEKGLDNYKPVEPTDQTLQCTVEEEYRNQGLQSEQFQEILSSPVVFGENQTKEDEEDGLGICNTEEPTEEISQCDSGANMDKPLTSIQPNTTPVGINEEDDLKEFTEEDQEGVKESLAEYPSDLFQSEGEGEEHAKHGKDQPTMLVDSRFDDDYSTNEKMKNLSREQGDNLQEENVESMDFMDSDPEIKIKELEDRTISEQIKSDLSTSFQNKKVHKDDLQDSQTNDSSTDEGDASNPLSIQHDYDNDVSGDHSTSHEETILGDILCSSSTSVRHEEEWKSEVQCNNLTEDLGKGDHDINYIGTDPQDRARIFPETDRDVPNPKLCSTLESVQLEQLVQPFIKAEDLLNSVKDTNTFIPEGFLSSDEGNLPFDDYDWSFRVEEPNYLILDEAEDQDYTENIEELDFDEDMEGVEQNERDWEQEKTRIEAFYKFYNDEVNTEDKSERNHKVTFCLDHESSEYNDQVDTEDKQEAKEHCSNLWDMPVDPPALNAEVISAAYSEDCESSEFEEDSESSEQELDTVPDTPVCAVQPECHSESDDEPQEKFFYPEKSKIHPKKQQHIDQAQNARPGKSKCLAVLKSVLALGLMTVIGVLSFWWATDNLDWMH